MNPLRYFVALVVGLLVMNAASQAQEKRLPTLFIIGDSTVKNPSKGLQGWGDAIGSFFDQTRIRIDNRARGGRSSRTYVTEGLWDQALAELKPGDTPAPRVVLQADSIGATATITAKANNHLKF